jgi:hypothetical protein
MPRLPQLPRNLAHGVITWQFHVDRTGHCYWAQLLGNQPSLFDGAKKNTTNYMYLETVTTFANAQSFFFFLFFPMNVTNESNDCPP